MHADVQTINNISGTEKLLSKISDKTKQDFGYEIGISGFENLYNNLVDEALESDIDFMRELNKGTTIWHNYFTDVIGLLSKFAEQYKNVSDIYTYLLSISITDQDLFAITAPKYKIDSTNIPYAIKEIERKQADVSNLVKSMKLAISKLTSYDKFVIGEYYKTSRIIRAFNKAERNISFVS